MVYQKKLMSGLTIISDMAHDRKKIPPTVMLKLWVKSGGRCEFPGCNAEVWRDGLTLLEDNFAHMAHIVAASPDGPRGDEELSLQLETDFENLLLLCQKCSKLIDGRNQDKYSVDQLVDYKRRHEDRIQMQTSLGPDKKTTVVRFEAPIRERRVPVAIAQAYEALEDRYPEDKGVFLDFSKKQGSGDTAFWLEYARDIATEVSHAFRTGNGQERYDHLSIFALAPIPVLVYFGNQVGNVVPTELYQKHRDTDDWKWKPEETVSNLEYIYKKPDAVAKSSDVALVLSLSGTIHPDSYANATKGMPVYEITIENPNPAFLSHKSLLKKFKVLYRTVVSQIQAVHGSDAKIHLFPAIPAPIAVTCGQQLLPKADPIVLIYDYDNAHGGFIQTLTINNYGN
jgi:SMODS-associated and fused to various effectors sensor domain